MLEVDIRIPNDWNETKYRSNTNLSPREFYDEFAPLFVTSEIPFDCIRARMQEYAKKNGLSQSPRTLLVGGLRAKKNITFLSAGKMVLEQMTLMG